MSDYKRMAELVKTHQLDEAIPLLAPLVAGAKAIGGAVAKKIGGSLAKKGAGALAKKLNPAKLLKKGAGRMPNKFSGKGVNLNITTTPEEDKELAENLYARMADLLMESKADRRARKRQNQGKPLSNQPAVRKSQETIRANAPKPKGPSLGDRLKQFGRDKALPRLQRAGALVGAGMARQAAGEALGKARDRVSPVVSRAAAGAATKMQSALARAVTSPAPKVTSTIGPTATAAPAAPTASPTPVTPTAPTAPTSAPSKPSETAKPVPQSKPEPKPEPKPAPEKSQKTTKDEKPKKGSKLKTATRVATALAAAERQGMQAGPLDINN